MIEAVRSQRRETVGTGHWNIWRAAKPRAKGLRHSRPKISNTCHQRTESSSTLGLYEYYKRHHLLLFAATVHCCWKLRIITAAKARRPLMVKTQSSKPPI
jgi:hypothetical protein